MFCIENISIFLIKIQEFSRILW